MGIATIQRRWTPADVRELMDESRTWPRYELARVSERARDLGMK